MIPWTIRLVFLATVTILGGWALAIGTYPDPSSWQQEEHLALDRSLPPLPEDALPPEEALLTPDKARLLSSLSSYSPCFSEQAEAALSVVSLRLHVVGPILLVSTPFLSSAFLLGLLFRERIRYGHGYASPTAAFLAKHLAGTSFIIAAVFALSPVRLPYWTLYATLSASFLGVALYVGNLPPKL